MANVRTLDSDTGTTHAIHYTEAGTHVAFCEYEFEEGEPERQDVSEDDVCGRCANHLNFDLTDEEEDLEFVTHENDEE